MSERNGTDVADDNTSPARTGDWVHPDAPWQCTGCEGVTWRYYRCTDCGTDLADQDLEPLDSDLADLLLHG